MHLIMFSDFMQVLHINRMHPTKNEYFSKHMVFTMIYLLQEQKLKPRNYFNQELITELFVRDTEYDMNMHAKIQSIGRYRYLQLNTLVFGFL